MSAPLPPHVLEGTRRMLALQQERVAAGAGRLGWKAAFGSPEGRRTLGTDRPLVGFLTRDRLLESGVAVPVEGWRRPVLEAEVAVHIGEDLPPAAPPDAVAAAVAGLSAAIELADVDPPPGDVVEVLSGNVFHRHVVLGPLLPERRDLTDLGDLTAAVTRNGTEVARTDDPEAATGRLLDVVTSMAGTLAQVDERLRAGDVLITGAVVPPLDIAPGDRLAVDLGGLGRLELSFR